MPRIAVIVNNVEGYARGILRGIMPFAFSRGWDCRVTGIGLPETSDNTRSVDGIIVQASSLTVIDRLCRLHVPMVNVSSSISAGSVPSVICDDLAVGRLGADHFIRRGFRRFIWYAPLDRHFAKLRQSGFLARLNEENLGCCIATDRPGLIKVLRSIDKPAAAMCCNDISALAVLEQCRMDHLKVPDQIAVLGVDNDDLVQSLASTPLSSIGTATEQIGFEAAALLERLMRKERNTQAIVQIPPTGIITRRSTDLTAVADPAVAEALRFIRQNATGRIGAEQVVKSTTVSRRQLERRFRVSAGRSILDEIRRCRLERARQLLVETDLTIPQIAIASGFASASYLTVVFGTQNGETPGHFRKNLRRRGVFQ